MINRFCRNTAATLAAGVTLLSTEAYEGHPVNKGDYHVALLARTPEGEVFEAATLHSRAKRSFATLKAPDGSVVAAGEGEGKGDAGLLDALSKVASGLPTKGEDAVANALAAIALAAGYEPLAIVTLSGTLP